ncbi:hypothetical protein ACIPUC_17725 [Streptomyces sp. LARHCF249]
MDDLAQRLASYLEDDKRRGSYVTLGGARTVLSLLTLLEDDAHSDEVRWAAGELGARIASGLPS